MDSGRSPEAKLNDLEILGTQFTFSLSGDSLGHPGVYRFSGSVDSSMRGFATSPEGADFTWHALKTSDSVAVPPDTTHKDGEKPKGKESVDSPLVLAPRLPDGDFGFTSPPVQEKLLALTGATLWTCGSQGILENATLVIAEGKIVGAIGVSGGTSQQDSQCATAGAALMK